MKRLFAVLSISFLLALAGMAFAHSGGTDAYGCHVDRKTGIRH